MALREERPGGWPKRKLLWSNALPSKRVAQDIDDISLPRLRAHQRGVDLQAAA